MNILPSHFQAPSQLLNILYTIALYQIACYGTRNLIFRLFTHTNLKYNQGKYCWKLKQLFPSLEFQQVHNKATNFMQFLFVNSAVITAKNHHQMMSFCQQHAGQLCLFIYCFTAQVMKIYRTPGPTACSKTKDVRQDVFQRVTHYYVPLFIQGHDHYRGYIPMLNRSYKI